MKASLTAVPFLIVLSACGSTPSTGIDASTGTDSGSSPMDSGASSDTGVVPSDTGVASDTGVGNDSGSESDSGSIAFDAGSGPCAATPLGLTCDDAAPCPAGYSCNLGRCIPQGRETCGGFAGAECPPTGHTVCMYRDHGGDVGTCLSPAETDCVCSLPETYWLCAG